MQAAHCENGVTTALLKHYGVHKLTEPMAFGIGSGLFYIQLPFMKVNGGPAISFRTMPGLIFKRTCKALGIPVTRKNMHLLKKRCRNWMSALLQANQQPARWAFFT
ncbi:BtrH N-terminal domain-containing protein [Niabella sp. W65]|nr:BtrH N-terminal domain-containing protein [Niabella sp. W65]MCH7368819.1 BtrH N-terminal domain-containing protein [Niabella sp. W65]